MQKMKKLFLSVILSCLISVAVAYADDYEYETAEIVINDVHLTVEIADTIDKRMRGLQFRDHLDDARGMLFVYQEERYLNFWMKDTPLPLDLAYIDILGKIVEVHAMAPHDTTVYRSRGKAQYVLEVNQGWFDANGVRVGDTVENLP